MKGKYSAASLAHKAGGVANALHTSRDVSNNSKKRPRKAPDGPLQDEEARTKSKRRVALVDVFGVDKLPPALQCVEYKLKGGFKGYQTTMPLTS